MEIPKNQNKTSSRFYQRPCFSAFFVLSTLSFSVTLMFFYYISTERSKQPDQKLIKSTIQKQSENKGFQVPQPPPDSIFSMDQKDKRLLEYIRNNHLTPPAIDKPYNFTRNIPYHVNGYSEFIYKLFGNEILGIYVEAGAHDGEVVSNSLFLEQRGWQGLLVEPNPMVLPQLMSKNRKAWIANVCLSPSDKPKILDFSTPVDWSQSAKLGRPLNDQEMNALGIGQMKNKTWLQFKIPCFPLYSIIAATGSFHKIDFLSLDVEGSEIAILKHFPFEVMKITAIIVEVYFFSLKEKADLTSFLTSRGYKLVLVANGGSDEVYVLRESNLRIPKKGGT